MAADERTATEREDPDAIDLVRELREAVGLFAGAMPITPKAAWREAIERVRLLVDGRADLVRLLHHVDGHLGLAVYRGEGTDPDWKDEGRSLMHQVRSTIQVIEATDGR